MDQGTKDTDLEIIYRGLLETNDRGQILVHKKGNFSQM